MSRTWRCRWALLLLSAAGACVFCTGIGWGLPSRASDLFLFGSREPWSGREILQLSGGRSESGAVGADVDRNPLTRPAGGTRLNATDADRAAIVLRYRLYTYQPDEMITLMALASMHPGQRDFDPKLYQYGGEWVYGVGAMLRVASIVRAITLRSDLAYYLDHPEEFGRFYIVARLYTVAWAIIGVWCVFALTARALRRDDGTPASLVGPVMAALCFITMPVVINMAHEAKPHLPGAVLMLLAVLAAGRYAESGERRWWMWTSIACGAAFGMVLSTLPIFILLPVMLLLRRQLWIERLRMLSGGAGIGLLVYLVTNPYIVINWFRNRAVLQSNFGNSLAMYEIGRWPQGLVNAAALIGEGTSVVLAIVGVAGAVLLLRSALASQRRASGAAPAWHATMLLLAAPAALILLQFVALAAGKPGEYGRFAVFPDVALGIAAVVAIVRRGLSPIRQNVLLGALVLLTAAPGSMYLHGFRRDSSAVSSRLATASTIQDLQERGARSLGVYAEPGPYDLPPVDLFGLDLVLQRGPAVEKDLPDLLICVAENRATPCDSRLEEGYNRWPGQVRPLDVAPISWANRGFDLLVRQSWRRP